MKSHTVVKDLYGSSRWRKEFLYFTWLRFATDYSNRVFGRESDMFPVLWATAKLYQSRLGKTEGYCRASGEEIFGALCGASKMTRRTNRCCIAA